MKMSVEEDESPSCSMCRRICEHPQQAWKHDKSEHYNARTWGYSCFKCLWEGTRFEDLVQHCLRRHDKHKSLHNCTYCDDDFQGFRFLLHHQLAHFTSIQCLVCLSCSFLTNSWSDLEFHFQKHTEDNCHSGKFTCQICNFVTNNRTVLQLHTQFHKGVSYISCNFCGWASNSVNDMLLHSKNHAAKWKTGSTDKLQQALRVDSKVDSLRKHLYTSDTNRKLSEAVCQGCGMKTPLVRNAHDCVAQSFIFRDEAESLFKFIRNREDIDAPENNVSTEEKVNNCREVIPNRKNGILKTERRILLRGRKNRQLAKTILTKGIPDFETFIQCKKCGNKENVGSKFGGKEELMVKLKGSSEEKVPKRALFCGRMFLKNLGSFGSSLKFIRCSFCSSLCKPRLRIVMSKYSDSDPTPEVQESSPECRGVASSLQLDCHKSTIDYNQQKHRNPVSTFTCNLCFKRFRQQRLLQHHLRSHSPCCNICRKQFKSHQDMIAHLRIKHNYTAFGMKTLYKKAPFKCRCRRKFIMYSNLVLHVKYHCKEQSRGFCKKDKPCNMKPTCACCAHLPTVAMEQHNTASKLQEGDTCSHVFETCTDVKGKPVALYSCKKCGLAIQSQKQEGNAVGESKDKPEREASIKEGSCMSSEESSKIDSGEESSGEDEFLSTVSSPPNEHPRCVFCSMLFKSTWALTLHQNEECQIFGSILARQCKLPKVDDGTYVCHFCGKMFGKRWSLTVHLRHHTGEKPYSCNLCVKQFFDSSALHKHLITHTGLRPFSCCMCDRAFTQRGNLKRHMNLVHRSDISPDSTFTTCPVCNTKINGHEKFAKHIGRLHPYLFKFPLEGSRLNEYVKKLENEEPSVKEQEVETEKNKKPVDKKVEDLTCTICNVKMENEETVIAHLMTDHLSTNMDKASDSTSAAESDSQSSDAADSAKKESSPDPAGVKTDEQKRQETIDKLIKAGVQCYYVSGQVGKDQMMTVTLQQKIKSSNPPHGDHTYISRNESKRAHKAPLAELPPKDTFVCKYCRRECSNQQTLTIHEKGHLCRFTCTICGHQSASSVTYECHLRAHKKKSAYTCHYCSEPFSSEMTYKYHLVSHEMKRDKRCAPHKSKSYVCRLCDEPFSSEISYCYHMASHESKQRLSDLAKSFNLAHQKRVAKKGNQGKRKFSADNKSRTEKPIGNENDDPKHDSNAAPKKNCKKPNVARSSKSGSKPNTRPTKVK